ncbi:glycosyltransferase family 2 protein [Metaplanococcus flavidus]|uniref:Glycosyltransferase family 2 protein n=1 Tax=Metaplanococcus flavidus TaxID=569883 RepID=A0ABW3LBH3_9BACL
MIVPVYNVENYIRRCIESLVKQKEFNSFEVLIINDGTKDGSIERIRDIVLKHPNIHLINQENRGLSEARNTGIRLAKGEFISFIDSDDWVESNMISTMYHAAIETKSEIAVCNIRVVYEKNEKLIKGIEHGFEGGSTITSKQALDYFFEHKKINGQVCNKIYRTELFTNHQILFPKGKAYEDLSACFALIWHSTNVVFLEDHFYNYLQRKGSITKKADLDFWHKVENVYLVEDFLIQKDMHKRYSEKFVTLLITTLFSVYLHLEKYKSDKNYDVLKQKLNGELMNLNIKKTIFSSKIPPITKVKFLIMNLRMDLIINLMLKMKALKDNTTV